MALSVFIRSANQEHSRVSVGAMGSEESKSKLEKFEGSDFAFWKSQIEDYLYQKDLYRPLMGKEKEKRKDESEEDWEILDRKAIGQIRLSLAKSVAHNILKEKTTVGLMAALAEMYEQPSVVNKVYLIKRLFLLRMVEDCPFTTHLSEFNTVVDQLTSVEIEFAEEVRALLLLQQMQRVGTKLLLQSAFRLGREN